MALKVRSTWLTQSIAIEGEQYPFNVNDPVANLGVLYGIFADRNGTRCHTHKGAPILPGTTPTVPSGP